MVLISHNALQPLAPTAPAATAININEPVPDEYASGGKKRRRPGEQKLPTNQRRPPAVGTQGWEAWQEVATQHIKGNSSEM